MVDDVFACSLVCSLELVDAPFDDVALDDVDAPVDALDDALDDAPDDDVDDTKIFSHGRLIK